MLLLCGGIKKCEKVTLIFTLCLASGALKIKKTESLRIMYQYDQYINPLNLAASASNFFK